MRAKSRGAQADGRFDACGVLHPPSGAASEVDLAAAACGLTAHPVASMSPAFTEGSTVRSAAVGERGAASPGEDRPLAVRETAALRLCPAHEADRPRGDFGLVALQAPTLGLPTALESTSERSEGVRRMSVLPGNRSCGGAAGSGSCRGGLGGGDAPGVA